MKLIFTRANTFESYLIRFVESCRDLFAGGFAQWSHVACVLADGTEIIDSMRQRDGVTKRTLASFVAGFPDHRVVEVFAPSPDYGDTWLLQQLGMPYGVEAGEWNCTRLAANWLRAADKSMGMIAPDLTCKQLLDIATS